MKLKYIVLAGLLLLATPAFADDYFTFDCKIIRMTKEPQLLLSFTPQDWDKPSQIAGGTLLFLRAYDLAETLSIVTGKTHQESNKVIQDLYDSFGELGVIGYFVAYSLAENWIADKLPPWARTLFFVVNIGPAYDTVIWNIRCGVRIRW